MRMYNKRILLAFSFSTDEENDLITIRLRLIYRILGLLQRLQMDWTLDSDRLAMVAS